MAICVHSRFLCALGEFLARANAYDMITRDGDRPWGAGHMKLNGGNLNVNMME